MALHLDIDLSLNHLSRVRAELFDFREKWFEIGLDFGLPKDKLDSIKQQTRSQDDSEYLLRMLIEWLKARHLKPTWRKVSQVVQKYSLEKILAKEIQGTPSSGHNQLDGDVHVPSVQPLEETDGAHTANHDQVDGASLSLDDLSKVRTELFEVQVKWYDIGLDLGLPVNTLETIKQECQDIGECLRRMIHEWLKAIDLQPTWRKLIDVLQNKVVNEGALAAMIAEKYNVSLISLPISQSHSPTPSQPSIQPNSSSTELKSPTPVQNLQINWKEGPKAPTAFDLYSCAAKGNSIFYYCATLNDIFEFDAEKMEWSTLSPVCPQKFFTLVVIKGMLCAVGGEDHEGQQNSGQGNGEKNSPIRGLMSEGPFKHWAQYFPHMTTQRNYVAAVYTQGVLIIAGGTMQSPQGEDITNTPSVEILDIDTKQWYTTCDLPYPIQRPSIITCGNDIFISGAYDNKVYTTTFTSLLLNASTHTDNSEVSDTDKTSIWQPIASCPTSNVYLAELDGKPIAVGGLISEESCSKEICMYDVDADMWNTIGNVSKPQRFSQVTVLAEDKIILAVGWTMNGFDDAVEIGIIDRVQESES